MHPSTSPSSSSTSPDGRVGWVVAKKASQNAESYFLAGKSLPWWIIGVAHGSSGVDITGTMWFVMMLFVYGVKGDLAAVGLAAVQRDLPHDVPGHLGAAVERADRRRVDADALRPQPRRGAGLPQRRGLRAGAAWSAS